jgi:thiol:disulfide interchange protein DsbD
MSPTRLFLLALLASVTVASAPSRAQAPATAVTPVAVTAVAPSLYMLDEFNFQGRAAGYVRTDKFLQFVSNTESGVKEQGMFEGRGPLAILLLVFVGGLALNLTPCVLPMIPINLAIIGAGTQAGSRGRGFLLGGVYGAAMAVVYGVLGTIVVLTAGTFGTLNSSPWFNLGIAVLFIALSLAMFDIFTIDFSRFAKGPGSGARRGSFALAFGMGAVAALLAGACVAPVVLQVVLFSSDLYSKGTPIALGLPFLLGIGMAVPWPFAGAGIAALPKPGAWMVRVKQAFGVIILATAAYYGYEAFGQFRAATVTAAAQSTVKDGWYHSLPDALAAAKAQNKPVFVDMWATWCKNCYVMDETTFQDPAVQASLDKYIKVKFQAEDPDAEPAKGLMARWDTVGLPTYVILSPR